MADSICGPSNAVQNLQKYTSVDRTLQQDRLTFRPSPLEGFRSVPGPSLRAVEAEFEAFQNSSSPIDHAIKPPHFVFQNTSNSHQPQLFSWVTDFKKLNLSHNHTQPNEVIVDTPHVRQLDRDWHQDLLITEYLSDSNDTPIDFCREANVTGRIRNNITPIVGNVNGIQFNHEKWLLPQHQPTEEIIDHEAFTRAFDIAAELEKDASEEKLQFRFEMEQRISINELTPDRMSPLKDDVHLTQVPIGADTIENEILSEENDQDSLSRTASRLLSSVHGEQSKKFQNCQFLELMRRFRDKEATIQGDKIVDVALGN